MASGTGAAAVQLINSSVYFSLQIINTRFNK